MMSKLESGKDMMIHAPGSRTSSCLLGIIISHAAKEYGGDLTFSIGVSATFRVKIIDN